MLTPFVPSMINALDIDWSVGNDAVNDPDDVARVKTMLNGVLLTDGGAEGALNPEDKSNSGPDFERMAFAIARFQALNFPGQFEPDGRIEPDRKTIKKLRVLYAQQKVPPPQVLGIAPLIPVGGDADDMGFSAAHLVRPPPRELDWIRRNPEVPVTQMVPMDEERTLVLTFGSPATARFSVEDEDIAFVKSTLLNIVTIKGRNPGKTFLFCMVGAFIAFKVQLIVRRSITKVVDVVHIGAPANANAPQLFLSNMLPLASRMFEQQANIRFTPGSSRSITASLLDGRPFSIGPGKFFILNDGEFLPHGEQGSRWTDLEMLVRDRNAITAFIGPEVRDLDPKIGGRAELGGRKCWFKTTYDGSFALHPEALPAHELGHTLGLRDIKSPPDSDYVMCGSGGGAILNRHLKIPSETLDDLTEN